MLHLGAGRSLGPLDPGTSTYAITYAAYPTCRPVTSGGTVIIESRLDRSLHPRFNDHYLAFHYVGLVGLVLGLCPPESIV